MTFNWTALSDALSTTEVIRTLNIRVPRMAQAMANLGTRAFVRSLEDFGAVGNGIMDDFPAMRAFNSFAVNQGGATLSLQPGKSYRHTDIFNITGPNITIEGNGATLLYQPTVAANSKAVLIDSPEVASPSTGSVFRNIIGTLATGDQTFTAALTADTSDLVAGDWLILQEADAALAEIVVIDWVQVKTVAGAMVTLQAPLRTTFPGTHGTIQFIRQRNLAQHIMIRNLSVRSTDTIHSNVGVAAYNCRDVVLDNVRCDMANGNALASYRASLLSLRNCHDDRGIVQSSEFAATVDLNISGCTWGTFTVSPTRPSLTLDFGTAFFSVVGNQIVNGGNSLVQLLYGCHDGVFAANTLGYARDAGQGFGNGIVAQGCQRVVVAHNALVGGAGVGTGIAFADATLASPTIPTSGNVIANNSITGFASPYGTMNANDSYLIPGLHAFTKRTDPAAPPATIVLLYARDNGSGKTQLVARFPTGAVQVLATEP